MLRTKKEAELIYTKNIPLITGKPLPPFFSLCLGNPINGMPKAALFLEEDNSVNMLGMDIVPRRYWESLSENGIIALITQEFVHGLLYQHVPEAVAAVDQTIFQMKQEYAHESRKQLYLREVAIREEAELYHGLIMPMLNWKLHIDNGVVQHLKDKNLPVIGHLELLKAEFEEEGRQAKPHSRRIARQWLVGMRIYHLNMLLNNTKQSVQDANTLRTYTEQQSIKILSHYSPKIPQSV